MNTTKTNTNESTRSFWAKADDAMAGGMDAGFWLDFWVFTGCGLGRLIIRLFGYRSRD